MAYLGKISAVVSANTKDFSKNIGAAKKQVQDFAKSMRGVELNLNTNALDKTLTKTQQFQAKIQTITKMLAKGIDGGLPDPRKLSDKFAVFEDLGKPIQKLVKQFEGLSTNIQAQLMPELSKVQAGFRNLYRDIDTGAATFDGSAQRIQKLTNQLAQLKYATAGVADLGGIRKKLDIENTGASFSQPDAKSAMQESLKLRGMAEKVDPELRGGVFAELALQAENNANIIEREAAKVAAIQLEMTRKGESVGRLNRLSAAQGAVDSATANQQGINAAFGTELRSVQIAQVVSPKAKDDVADLTNRFVSLSSQLRSIDSERFNGLITTFGQVNELLNRGAVGAKDMKRALESMEGMAGLAGVSKSLGDQATGMLYSQSELKRRSISEMGAKTIGVPGSHNLTNASLAQESLVSDSIPRVQAAMQRASSIGDNKLIGDTEGLKTNLRELNDLLSRIGQSSSPSEAAAGMDEYRAKIFGVNEALEDVEGKIKTAERASKKFQQFTSISGSGENRLGSNFDRAAGDVAVARQFVGNFEKNDGREGAIQGIQSTIAEYQQLIQAQEEVFDSDMDSTQQAAELNKITDRVKELRLELVKTISEQSKMGGGKGFSEAQVGTAMDRAAKNRGSFGMAGMQSAQMAMQQGLFAIDDFMSSTGGLEYKLRAIGNNISQMGLLLGQSGLIPGLSATTGLFAGMAFVMGGQLISAAIRFINQEEEMTAQTDALNDQLKSSQNVVEQLAEAYKELGNAVKQVGLSDVGSRDAQREEQVKEAIGKRKEALQERLAATDPRFAEVGGQIKQKEEQLEEEKDIGKRAELAGQLDILKKRRKTAIENAGTLDEKGFNANFEAARRARNESGIAANSLTALSGAQEIGGYYGGYLFGAGTDGMTGRAKSSDIRELPMSQVRDYESDSTRALFEAQNEAARGGFGEGEMSRADLGETIKMLKNDLEQLKTLSMTEGIADGAAQLTEKMAELESATNALEAKFENDLTAGLSRVADESFKVSDKIAEAQAIVGGLGGDRGESLRKELDAVAITAADVAESLLNVSTQDELDSLADSTKVQQQLADELLKTAKAAELAEHAFKRFSDIVDGDISAASSEVEEAMREDTLLGTDKTRQRLGEARGLETFLRDLKADDSVSDEVKAETSMRMRGEFFARQKGRDLATSEEDKFTENLDKDMRNLQLATGFLEVPGGTERQKMVNNAGKKLAKDAAPMLFDFRQERQNAALKGPSRQALSASDVSTTAGAAEFNRLLRGDDSNRDVNLVELQQQTQKLSEIVEAIRESTGLTVEL